MSGLLASLDWRLRRYCLRGLHKVLVRILGSGACMSFSSCYFFKCRLVVLVQPKTGQLNTALARKHDICFQQSLPLGWCLGVSFACEEGDEHPAVELLILEEYSFAITRSRHERKKKRCCRYM